MGLTKLNIVFSRTWYAALNDKSAVDRNGFQLKQNTKISKKRVSGVLGTS